MQFRPPEHPSLRLLIEAVYRAWRIVLSGFLAGSFNLTCVCSIYEPSAAAELAALGGAVGESLVAADLAALVSHKRTARMRSVASLASMAVLTSPMGADLPLSPPPLLKAYMYTSPLIKYTDKLVCHLAHESLMSDLCDWISQHIHPSPPLQPLVEPHNVSAEQEPPET